MAARWGDAENALSVVRMSARRLWLQAWWRDRVEARLTNEERLTIVTWFRTVGRKMLEGQLLGDLDPLAAREESLSTGGIGRARRFDFPARRTLGSTIPKRNRRDRACLGPERRIEAQAL